MRGRNYGTTCDMDSSYKNDKLIYPAASRSKDPILQAFKKVLPKHVPCDQPFSVLEISSGSGQHTAHIAPHFPHGIFQPSEYDPDLLASISIYAEECATKNVNKPLLIDICQSLSCYNFKEKSIDVIYNANMMHISPYECTKRLFSNAGLYLKSNGIMISYGPYALDGVITPESNVNLDQFLRSQDPLWGLRDIKDLTVLAKENHLHLEEIIDMPSNNKCVVWKKV